MFDTGDVHNSDKDGHSISWVMSGTETDACTN